MPSGAPTPVETSSQLSLKTSSSKLIAIRMWMHNARRMHADCKTSPPTMCHVSTSQCATSPRLHNVPQRPGTRVYMYNTACVHVVWQYNILFGSTQYCVCTPTILLPNNILPHPHPLSHTQTNPHTCMHIHEHRCRHKSVTVCV